MVGTSDVIYMLTEDLVHLQGSVNQNAIPSHMIMVLVNTITLFHFLPLNRHQNRFLFPNP